jgi:molecular chaperone GrpE
MADPNQTNATEEAAPTNGAGAPAQAETASERAEGKATSPEEPQRELSLLRAQLEESQARARETQARLVEEHDRLLRSAADHDNYKKRAQKEKDDARKFGNESMVKEFLPVADNLDRALEHAATADPKTVIDGVRLVQKLLESTLQRFGVSSFSALGLPFDPNVHEALMSLESDQQPGTVVQEMARGYRLHDRLVRPAAVVVAKARQAVPASDPQRSPGGGAQPASGGAAQDGATAGPTGQSET